MEERILSGYCRILDQSRMVTAELEDGVWTADCSFDGCPYRGSCAVAGEIVKLGDVQ